MSISQTSKTLDHFALNDVDEASSTVTYLGLQSIDGDWYLKKIDSTSGVSVGHATKKNNSSTTSYTTAWTSRASLVYGDYQEAF